MIIFYFILSLCVFYVIQVVSRKISSPFWCKQPIDTFHFSYLTPFKRLFIKKTPFQTLTENYDTIHDCIPLYDVKEIDISLISKPYIECLNHNYVEQDGWTYNINHKVIQDCYSKLICSNDGGFVSSPLQFFENGHQHRFWSVDMFCIHPYSRGKRKAPQFISSFVSQMFKYGYKQFIFKLEYKPLKYISPHIEYNSCLYDTYKWDKYRSSESLLIEDPKDIYHLLYCPEYVDYLCIPSFDILYSWIQHKCVFLIKYKSSLFIFRDEYVQYFKKRVLNFIGCIHITRREMEYSLNDLNYVLSTIPVKFRYLWIEPFSNSFQDIVNKVHKPIKIVPMYYYFYNTWIPTKINPKHSFIII